MCEIQGTGCRRSGCLTTEVRYNHAAHSMTCGRHGRHRQQARAQRPTKCPDRHAEFLTKSLRVEILTLLAVVLLASDVARRTILGMLDLARSFFVTTPSDLALSSMLLMCSC